MMTKAEWSDASTNQGTPKSASKPLEVRKRQEKITYWLHRKHGPIDTLISISSLQICEIINTGILKFVVFCHGSSRKLIGWKQFGPEIWGYMLRSVIKEPSFSENQKKTILNWQLTEN